MAVFLSRLASLEGVGRVVEVIVTGAGLQTGDLHCIGRKARAVYFSLTLCLSVCPSLDVGCVRTVFQPDIPWIYNLFCISGKLDHFLFFILTYSFFFFGHPSERERYLDLDEREADILFVWNIRVRADALEANVNNTTRASMPFVSI